KIQKAYENCIGDCQTITNPILDVKYKHFSVFGGLNSIGSNMIGIRHETVLHKNVNLTYGTYYQDNRKYLERDVIVQPAIGNMIPLVGVDLHKENYGLIITPITSSFYIKF